MELPIYQVDAFTSEVFKGNPAAVVPLEEWLPDEILQKIALENNLSETAFFVPTDKGFHLRWFTPTVEVDLCGHATLATSWVIYNQLGYDKDAIHFESQSGELIITKSDDGYTLNFPVWEHKKLEPDARISDALGAEPSELFHGYDWVAVFDSYETVKNLAPDMQKLSTITEMRGIIATAQSNDDVDFVSRFFGPLVGIDEDPVTGSAHCILTPIWAEKLDKTDFTARQVSARSGDLKLSLQGDRVHITGNAALYLKGTIYI